MPDRLHALLASAMSASPSDRIEFRDPIAAFGLEAIRAMAGWLTDPRLGAFAVRVIERIGADHPSAAVAALRKGVEGATPVIQRDAEDAIGRIGGSRGVAGHVWAPTRRRRVIYGEADGRGGRGLGRRLTEVFMAGALDLQSRPYAPESGWNGMPEFVGAAKLRERGATDVDIRLWLTFTVAMDRIRDADALARSSVDLWLEHRWAFDPAQIVAHDVGALAELLKVRRISKLHRQDAAAWRQIAASILDVDRAAVVRRAIYEGDGDARAILRAVGATSQTGVTMFPLLRGPKISRLWIRELASPGGADLTDLESIEVAVDVQVRKVTEYLGVTDTGDLTLEVARAVIQRAWKADVAAFGAAGPGPIANTSSALDPALWFFAKWGCTPCEQVGRRVPISPICADCRFPIRSQSKDPTPPT